MNGICIYRDKNSNYELINKENIEPYDDTEQLPGKGNIKPEPSSTKIIQQ